MAGSKDVDISETPLRSRLTHDAIAGRTPWVGRGRNHHFILRRRREPLLAVPRHVLDREQGAVVHEHEVEVAVHDDGPQAALNDAGENSQRRRNAVRQLG
jgi:hypothetical protein